MSERFYSYKSMEIAGAHALTLPYESKCQNLHGHSWNVTVGVTATKLNECGMVVDFAHIKKAIHDKLDHQYINEILPAINPTAENLAKWMAEEVDKLCEGDAFCHRVEIWESANNLAVYERSIPESK